MNKRVNIYIDSELHKKIKLLAVSEETNFSELVSKLLEKYLEDNVIHPLPK